MTEREMLELIKQSGLDNIELQDATLEKQMKHWPTALANIEASRAGNPLALLVKALELLGNPTAEAQV